MSEASEKNVGRNSKWTSIYWGIHEGQMRPFVRLTPNFLDLESLGFAHGLSVSPALASEQDAHSYADRIDAFVEAMVRESEQSGEACEPSRLKVPQFLRTAAARLGQLPRWVKVLMAVQWIFTMAALHCLTMVMAYSADSFWAMTRLAASLIQQLAQREAATAELVAVVEASAQATPWMLSLCIALIAASASSATVLALIPGKRAKQRVAHLS